MDDLLIEFLTETAENLEIVEPQLLAFEADPSDRATLDNIFRLVHTIKGACGFLGLARLEAVAHAVETLLGRFRDAKLDVTPGAVTLVLRSIDRIKALLGRLETDGVEPDGDDAELIARLEAAAESEVIPVREPQPEPVANARWDAELGRALRPGEVTLAELEAAFQCAAGPPPTAAREEVGEDKSGGLSSQSVRVGVDVIERLMAMVSELVLTRNQLLQMVRALDDSELQGPLQRLSNITAELQDGVMKTRMQPIGAAWKKLPRLVRDCSHGVGKQIELVTDGEHTELDRQVLELVRDPLTHMVRNACDHGVEPPDARIAAGKPACGTVRVSAYHEGGHVIIRIADDGAGLPTERIRAKAIENGLISQDEAAGLADAQVQRFILHPGFSTAAEVTNLSGRGVGMDVVRVNIERIGGAIELASAPGRGSTFTIKIPLTLAIVSALIVEAAGARFAIPQVCVTELVRVGGRAELKVERINQARVMRLRDRLLPVVDMVEVLGLEPTRRPDEAAYVVVMQASGVRFGVVVDGLSDAEEIVVKPLARLLRGVEAFSGATILGDGSVIMIADPNGLAAAVGEVSSAEIARADCAVVEGAFEERDERTSVLMFRAGSPEPKAVPLSLITRLEKIDVAAIERADGRLVTQYRGKLMPLLTVSPATKLRETGRQPILVFSDRGRSAGLIVDEILDIAEERVSPELLSKTPGVVGAAVIQGKATEVLDADHHLARARPDWFDRDEEESALADKGAAA